jgi:hypothetical protein
MRSIYGNEHLYMPYNMKAQSPKAVAQAIVKQNQLITERYVIVLVGVSQDITNELKNKILQETIGATAISNTNRTDKMGRWYIIIKEKLFIKRRKHISANLHQWIQEYPAILHETKPDNFPPPQVNQKYVDDDDDSSGHTSYMLGCTQTYGTMNNTDKADKAYFYPPSNKNNTHNVTEIQFSTETELRAIIQTL